MFVSIYLACSLYFYIRTPKRLCPKSSYQAYYLPKLLIQMFIQASAHLQTWVSRTHHVHPIPNNMSFASFDLYVHCMPSCCRWGGQQHTMRQLQMQQLEVCWVPVRTLVCPSSLECSPQRTWNRYNLFINQGMHSPPAWCYWTSGSRQWMAHVTLWTVQSCCAILSWCAHTWLGGSMLAPVSLSKFVLHLLDISCVHATCKCTATKAMCKSWQSVWLPLQDMLQPSSTCHICWVAAGCIWGWS